MHYLDGTACSVSVRLSLFPADSALPRPFRSTQLTASVQTMAGIIALYNDYRMSAFRPPVGFLNPLLYSTGFTGVNDIKWGFNPGCGTSGFSAAPGWDPVRPSAPVSFPSPFRRWLICGLF